MTLPSHQREVTAHAHNLRGISSCLITAEEVAAQIVFVFYHGLNGLNESEPLELLEPLNHLNSLNPSRLSPLASHWKQDKNQKNPLERMEGVALLLCFRLGLIRASS